ncbi:AraC family transcriptional regulator [Treponema sp. OttesenSCG-928-L16]|nr:AraC family transcriptional regulator [Treponema sp. OttesenSCG-928-L16]
MRIIREYNRIPQKCSERFIPSHMLNAGIFAQMGVINGGISTFYGGSFIKRPGGRDYHILILTISGEGKFTMEDERSLISRAQDIFFSHAGGQGHIHHPNTDPWTFLWLQIDTNCSWLIPPFNDWGIIPVSTAERASRLHGIQESILNEELNINDEGRRVQELNAELFMIHLQRELHMQQDPRLARYQIKMNQLWKTVAGSVNLPWNLEDMSASTGISRAHLSRLCTAMYRKSPGEKVREIKMEHAKSLLEYFDCQVSDVSEVVGYENTSNFSAAFKRHFGYSPREAARRRIPSRI